MCFAQFSSTLVKVGMSPAATCKHVCSILQVHVMLWVVDPGVFRLLQWIDSHATAQCGKQQNSRGAFDFILRVIRVPRWFDTLLVIADRNVMAPNFTSIQSQT